MNIMLYVGSIFLLSGIFVVVFSIMAKRIKNNAIDYINTMQDKLIENKKNMFDEFITFMESVLSIYGIKIFVNFELFKNTKYKTIGNDIIITSGIITHKEFISKDNMIDKMVKMKINDIPINSSTNIIKDYYIVKLIDKFNSKEYIINNKTLFDNIDINDEVFITIINGEIKNIGFEEKHEG